MSELINRIRKHNSWRRGEHSEVYNVTQIGLDLDRIADEHDKLTEQNKMLREALESICRMDNYVYADVVARKALGATK